MQEQPKKENEIVRDMEKLQNIVSALDYLRKEAKTMGMEDVQNIVDSSFKMLLSAYNIILSREHGERRCPESFN